ncbi:hypothetical protein I553_3319 [Mycobacterium xenopi 4042]|uniref:Uncharacterized protein n=1 Tax=Mycobacterium xenopi 4042 TaxID=1299334 RepID=X8CKK2_MYCXE|nr:hypothetical protein I553_3319 [Mycobacterium xenopi 4042]
MLVGWPGLAPWSRSPCSPRRCLPAAGHRRHHRWHDRGDDYRDGENDWRTARERSSTSAAPVGPMTVLPFTGLARPTGVAGTQRRGLRHR